MNKNTITKIGKYWEQFYSIIAKQNRTPLWEVPLSQSVENDYILFKSYFNRALPLIDLGCGLGKITIALASYYQNIVGIDASLAAIKLAQQNSENVSNKTVTFLSLDVLNFKAVQALHQQLGDANIYMRGVLHQIPVKQRVDFINAIQVLLGKKGTLYLVETSSTIQDYLAALAPNFSQLPFSIQRVLKSNLPPLGLTVQELKDYFPHTKFTLLEHGETHLNTNLEIKTKKIKLPALYSIIQAKK